MSGDQTAFIAPYVLSPSHTTVLYAGRSRVYRSSNEGSSWTATNAGAPLDPSFNPVLCLAVSWTNPDIAYAGVAPINARARVFRTTNGGVVWDDVTNALPDRYPSDLAVDPNDPSVVYVTFTGYGNSHLFRSTDAGTTWDDIGDGLPDVPASSVTVDPVHPDVLYVGTDLGVFVTPDAGESWFSFQSGMPMAMVNDLTIYGPERLLQAAIHGNGLPAGSLRSDDGGCGAFAHTTGGSEGASESRAAPQPCDLRSSPGRLGPADAPRCPRTPSGESIERHSRGGRARSVACS